MGNTYIVRIIFRFIGGGEITYIVEPKISIYVRRQQNIHCRDKFAVYVLDCQDNFPVYVRRREYIHYRDNFPFTCGGKYIHCQDTFPVYVRRRIHTLSKSFFGLRAAANNYIGKSIEVGDDEIPQMGSTR